VIYADSLSLAYHSGMRAWGTAWVNEGGSDIQLVREPCGLGNNAIAKHNRMGQGMGKVAVLVPQQHQLSQRWQLVH
jgi:hypothetical protein